MWIFWSFTTLIVVVSVFPDCIFYVMYVQSSKGEAQNNELVRLFVKSVTVKRMINGIVQFTMLLYFFVLRVKFNQALKRNRLSKFYRQRCFIRSSVILFVAFYWIHCSLCILDGVWAAGQYMQIENNDSAEVLLVSKQTEYALIANEVLNLVTLASSITFFYLHATNVKRAEVFIRKL